jgi:hypothetical protein
MTEQSKAHPGCARIETWLNANGYPCTVNGYFDDETRRAMRAALLPTGVDTWPDDDRPVMRHAEVIARMATLMGEPDLIDEAMGR